MSFHSNPQLELAFDYVRNTHKNIFLTGKAGTGKTTFLQQIKHESPKRMAVVAPTGVAAINAGGMTIHSFFQLPFGPFLPNMANDAARQRRFSREKIRLLRSLDLLVIDEISMVRADLLDAIDDVLRRYRDRSKPFGGVQLLMIGDLHQLPPVVKDDEWYLLREHYQTAYFFGSHALQNTQPVSIELKHIYRQSDSTFIDLLNKVRNNKIDAEVLQQLNSRYVPNFEPEPDNPYITLTAHNASAQEINAEKLAAIQQPAQSFKAVVQGDFPTFAYPADETFECKLGAQVMFVKNDISREKRYYNGKIGQITSFGDKTIVVSCPGEKDEIEVGPAEWTNVKYSLNEQSKEVEEEVLGTFIQYPLKLAWAITIHKSQGLTFDRAIIDAQAAFAHGQVYVALSRCKSFEGIVLRSKIANSSVKTDFVVKNYTDEAEKNAPDEKHLSQSKAEYQQSLLMELFDFSALRRCFSQFNRVLFEHERAIQPQALQILKTLDQQAKTQVIDVAQKFIPQFQYYFAQAALPDQNEELLTRLKKAGEYFCSKLGQELQGAVKDIPIISDNKSAIKMANEALENLQKEIFVKNACFLNLQQGFGPQRYLRAKADAELDFKASKATQPTFKNAAVPKGVIHPALYMELKSWRDDMADMLDVEAYEILPARSMNELVQLLPLNLSALKKITGIGNIKAQRYGADIIALIQEYCTENNIDTGQLPEMAKIAVNSGKAKTDSKKVSFELFQAGKTIQEIALERNLAGSTIEGHLAHFVGEGQLDINVLMPPEKVLELEGYFRDNASTSMSEAKAHFEDKYSYTEIRMVLEYLKGRQARGEAE
jgi:tRNA uridine 5-carbamoylmethylation protein Kti12